ncbi:acyloxyacyl hydrolase [Geomonas ferrireducens]|uniref:acyloxyacyl hydrolase n=1 Tax=Geomonas ferrireducens TaxID=2570227 RepID=UPI0010A774A8|nr:acyloxyacyl hydrolase [Geomonas ferrireducens]
MKSTFLLLIAALALLPMTERSAAAGSWGPLGIRGGVSADGKDNSAYLIEAFGTYQLPWGLRNKAGWGVWTEAAITAGTLSTEEDNGFIGTLGPAFRFGNPDFPVELDLGVSIAIISRDRFGLKDYNGIQQFVSHAELIYHFTPGFGLSYRFQHMSNAGFNGGPNPGINMHLIGVDWYP